MIINDARIWKTGGGSWIVTIPKDRAERKGFKLGDLIDVEISKPTHE